MQSWAELAPYATTTRTRVWSSDSIMLRKEHKTNKQICGLYSGGGMVSKWGGHEKEGNLLEAPCTNI